MREDECFCFYSSLYKKETIDNIKLVVECVIVSEDKTRTPHEIQYISGGYGILRLFGSKDPQQVDLQSGSPRDLLTNLADPSPAMATFSILIKEYSKLDHLMELVPENNLVNQKDLIPGVDGQRFPLPSKDPKVKAPSLELVPKSYVRIVDTVL